MKTTEDKDILLIERILRGETPAYRELVNRHKDYAFTIAYRILGSREDAEERRTRPQPEPAAAGLKLRDAQAA